MDVHSKILNLANLIIISKNVIVISLYLGGFEHGMDLLTLPPYFR